MIILIQYFMYIYSPYNALCARANGSEVLIALEYCESGVAHIHRVQSVQWLTHLDFWWILGRVKQQRCAQWAMELSCPRGHCMGLDLQPATQNRTRFSTSLQRSGIKIILSYYLCPSRQCMRLDLQPATQNRTRFSTSLQRSGIKILLSLSF